VHCPTPSGILDYIGLSVPQRWGRFFLGSKEDLWHYCNEINEFLTQWNRTRTTIWCCMEAVSTVTQRIQSFPSADFGTA